MGIENCFCILGVGSLFGSLIFYMLEMKDATTMMLSISVILLGIGMLIMACKSGMKSQDLTDSRDSDKTKYIKKGD